MIKLADDDLQKWLESIRDLNEPAEYYVAVIDSYGKVVAKSSMHAVPVRRDCTVRLNAVEVGESRNLTVGETRPWQQGEPVFHWLCEGVVTRIDDAGDPARRRDLPLLRRRLGQAQLPGPGGERARAPPPSSWSRPAPSPLLPARSAGVAATLG